MSDQMCNIRSVHQMCLSCCPPIYICVFQRNIGKYFFERNYMMKIEPMKLKIVKAISSYPKDTVHKDMHLHAYILNDINKYRHYRYTGTIKFETTPFNN